MSDAQRGFLTELDMVIFSVEYNRDLTILSVVQNEQKQRRFGNSQYVERLKARKLLLL